MSVMALPENKQERREEVRRAIRYSMLPSRFVTYVATYYPDDVEPAGLALVVIKYNTDGRHVIYDTVITDEEIMDWTDVAEANLAIKGLADNITAAIILKEGECLPLDCSTT